MTDILENPDASQLDLVAEIERLRKVLRVANVDAGNDEDCDVLEADPHLTPGQIYAPHQTPIILEEKPPLRLDLGSGPRPKEGFHGVDIVDGAARYCFDLSSAGDWPFPSDSVDEMHSSHFIEHLDAAYHRGVTGYPGGRVDVLYRFFDEAYRVAKPGAVLTCIWPALKSARAFQDPTHRRFIPAEQIGYLSREGRKQLGQEHLGIKCNWVGDVTFNVVLTPEDQRLQEEMALLSDMSDKKLAYAKEQQRRYVESWDRGAHDFIAVLRAVK